MQIKSNGMRLWLGKMTFAYLTKHVYIISPYTDTTAGFRAYSTFLLSYISVCPDGYTHIAN